MNEQELHEFKKLSVDEVLEAVQNGKISAEDAFALESQGKARKTLLEALEELTEVNQSEDNKSQDETPETLQDETPEEEPELITVKLIENIKLGTELFKAGDKLGVDENVYENLFKAKVIAVED